MKKFIIIYFFFLFFFFSFFASGVIDSQDAFQYLGVARNIYYTREPTAPSPLDFYNGEKNIHMSTEIAANGKAYSPTGLGYSLAMVPAVAVTDFFYKLYHISLPEYFPLQADWMILMTASFTNCFFAASLGVILFLYFLTLGLNRKQALFMSLVSLLATNLFAYSKHMLAHMMFITFLMGAFLALKFFSQTGKKIYLFISGLAYGVVIITYNQTFIFTLPSYLLYFHMLNRQKINFNSIKKSLFNAIFILVGVIPFTYVYSWYNALRDGANDPPTNLTSFVTTNVNYVASYLQVGVLFEGLYGLLLSPGRSVFLYSPLLLIPFIFWFKINKKTLPELVAFISISIVYVAAFASVFSIGKSDQGITGLWHGEVSWGPRYILPIVPFGMLLVAYIFKRVHLKEKLVTFAPLILVGLYIEMLGILMPYQIKFHDTQYNFVLNGTEYTRMVYTNLLPRYSPLVKMSKKLVKLIILLPKTLDHGPYNVRFYDGIDFPFNVGGLDRWRVIEEKGYMYFDDLARDPVRKVRLNLVNHPLNEKADSPAYVNFKINNKKMFEEDITLNLNERKSVDISFPQNLLQDKNNHFEINVGFDNNSQVVKNHSQFVAMISMFINDKEVNKESIDVPYISEFGPKMTGVEYVNWGGTNKDPWKGWHIHTQVFERVPDFWWAKAMYYWDFPKKAFLILFIFNVGMIAFFGSKTFQLINKNER
jgi:hypothetical protein